MVSLDQLSKTPSLLGKLLRTFWIKSLRSTLSLAVQNATLLSPAFTILSKIIFLISLRQRVLISYLFIIFKSFIVIYKDAKIG